MFPTVPSDWAFAAGISARRAAPRVVRDSHFYWDDSSRGLFVDLYANNDPGYWIALPPKLRESSWLTVWQADHFCFRLVPIRDLTLINERMGIAFVPLYWLF
jgi:hypothetical protein